MDGARLDYILSGKNYKDLIKKGTFFSKVIAYAPFTIAAMHAVVTGTYGFKTGVNSYWSSPKFKEDQYKTLSSYLKDSGYLTYGDVINKLVLPKIGFDDLVIHDELKDDLLTRHIELIDKFNKKKESKFFLYLHYSNIHTGIMEEVLKKYDNFNAEYFKNKEKNKIFYDKLFVKADEYLGKIIQHCEEIGLTEDTLIVVISDHGISVGEKFGERAYGVFCYDYTLISTALFYHRSLPKTSIDSQTRSIDILPTILEILSIPEDKTFKKMDGSSLVPLIHGKKESRVAFSQAGNPLDTGKPPVEPNVWSVRTDQWKYIRNIYDGSEEIYNLMQDPKEEKNVILGFDEIASELRKKMDEIIKDGN